MRVSRHVLSLVICLVVALISGKLEAASIKTIDNIRFRHAAPLQRALAIRGGSSDEENGVEEDEIESTTISSTLLNVSKKGLKLLGKATLCTVSASARSIQAAFQPDEAKVDEDEEPSALTKFARMLKRMWNAARHPPDSEREEIEEPSVSVTSKQTATEKTAGSSRSKQRDNVATFDFGDYLSKSYGVIMSRDPENAPPILGGTISDALKEARSKARLLVVFVPASRPGGKNTPDQAAIKSLLSAQVAEIAEKRARKKVDSGSFTIWGAKASSPEAVTAIKRLRAKHPKGDKRPTLVVAYPAQVLDSSGRPKLVPKLLAQHHCSPPPSEESMMAWLNALRKRHAKQYASMQHEQKEAQLFRERQEGYKTSVVSDLERREQEKKAEVERIAKEKAEKERLEAMELRREELLESLPAEPGKDVADVMVIALRFSDGRSGQRRFTTDTPLSTLFNWVDAMYQVERESVVLTTMNGQKSFSWDEAVKDSTTLKETGLGKMTGLRVLIKKDEEEKQDKAEQANSVQKES